VAVSLYSCNPLTVRPEEARQARASRVQDKFEWLAAQLWVYWQYRRWFTSTAAPNQFILADTEYEMLFGVEKFFTRPNNQFAQVVWDTVIEDFRNAHADAMWKKLKKLLDDPSASPAYVAEFIRTAREGGKRKPDMLGVEMGLAPGVRFDLLEVGTEKTADSTAAELADKLRILRERVVPVLSLRLDGRGQSWDRRIEVRASPFRMPQEMRILPLPLVIDQKSGTRWAEWVCYHPTELYKPGSVTSGGHDGLVLYHIHRAPLPTLPEGLRKKFEAQAKAGTLQPLTLLPELAQVRREDWPPELKLALAAIGVAALATVIVLIALTPPGAVGLAAGAGAASAGAVGAGAAGAGAVGAGAIGTGVTGAGLTAAGATPAFTGTMAATANYAPLAWSFAVGAAAVVPMPPDPGRSTY
jgi:hypothetical protein